MSNALTHIETEKQLVPALRFKEFEGEWDKMNLSNVCAKIQDGNYGGSYPKSEEFVKEGIPFLTSKALGGDGILKEDKIDFLPLKKHQELKKAHLKLNDVLFTNRGSNVGSIGFTDERISHGNIGPQLTLLRSDLNIIKPHFLFQIMTSNVIKKQVSSQDSGSAMNFFGIGATSKFKFNIPTLPEQQKIASFLSAVDEKIQQLTKKKALLVDYKKGGLQQLFSGQLRFKDENGKDYPDWEEKRLGEVATFLKGKGISKADLSNEGVLECIRYGELYTVYGETIIEVFSRTNVSEKELILSVKDDVIIPASGETQIDIATASCVRKSNVALGGDLNIIRSANDGVFLAYYLNSALKFDIARLSQGVSVVHLYSSQLKTLKIGVPKIEEQQKIATYLSRIDTKIESVNNQITQTQTFKKGLLQRMFV
jgi:type I restriction enzyme S subunit